MIRAVSAISADRALRIVLAGALLLVVGANVPGHLSPDSVAQLYEGHFHVRETWGPAIDSWLVGVFDAVIPGTSLYVVAFALLFFASLAGLAAVRGRVTWLAVAVAAFIALTPQVLIYQGIVWKDVAFANTAIGGATCLAQALVAWDRRRTCWLWLAASLVLFAVASLVRQNGVLVPAVSTLALGWVASRGDWRRGLAWVAGALVALAALVKILSIVCTPAWGVPDPAIGEGLRIVETYDLTGAEALDPDFRLVEIARVKPKQAEVIRNRAWLNWSPDRVDWMDRDPVISAAFNDIPNDLMTRQWLAFIAHDPAIYLRVRWEDFKWLVFSPNIDRCLPVEVGVDGMAEKLKALGLSIRWSNVDQELANYDTWWEDTALQRHWAYAVLALALAGALLWRRQPADLAVAGLLLGALATCGSFFVISIACDYRYLYFLDLTAMVGLFYVALDPAGFRRRPRDGGG